MRLKILILFFLISSNLSFAQDLISVTYEGYVNSTPNLDRYKNNPQKLAEMEKAFASAAKVPSVHILTMNKDEASFLLEERIQNDQPKEKGISTVKFTACNDMYLNYKEEYVLNELMLANKNYAIKSPLKAIDWEYTSEQKEVLGYVVRKATAVYDSITKVEAWYAPKFLYKNGPSQYWGLPGMILELDEHSDYGNGIKTDVHYIAIAVEPGKPSAKIKKFEKLEQITQDEYDKKLEKLQKAWQEMDSDNVDKD